MAIDRARLLLARVFTQRCFYLFVALLGLITGAPFVIDTELGRVVLTMLNVFVLIAAVAAVGRHLSSFVIAVTIAIAIILLQFFGMRQGVTDFLQAEWWLSVVFYVAAVIYLLGYVMRRDVLTMDKLWAGASVYLMMGVTWGYAYALVQSYHPGAFAVGGTPVAEVAKGDLIYFSFTVLTSTGFGDMYPLRPAARVLVTLEQIVGTLFVAIFIARLASDYPSRQGASDSGNGSGNVNRSGNGGGDGPGGPA
jgi:hypothetical protein